MQYLQQAVSEIAAPKSNDALSESHRVHDYLADGFRLSYSAPTAVVDDQRA